MRHPLLMLRAAHPLVKLCTFIALSALAVLSAGPLTGLVLGLGGLAGQRVTMAIFGGSVSLLLLAANAIMLRLERQPLSTLGLTLRRRRLLELAGGFAVSALLFSAIALARGASVGAQWEFHGRAGAVAALIGLPLALSLLLGEELLFRGYAFRKLTEAWGARGAIAISALAFGAYHLLGSHDWAMGAFFHFLMPALGGIVFGYAAWRTGGLALPLGLHLGGNWVQASVFGLGVQSSESLALWSTSLSVEQIRLLTAPDLLPRAPYLLALALMVLLVARWPSPHPRTTVG